MTYRYGLLGEKLTHSFSPQIHAMLGDYEYRLYEKAPEEVERFIRNGDFDGLNVTIPHKKTVIPFCAELSDGARDIGCVNTIIKRPDGTLFGDNTDFFGFSYLLGKTGAEVFGKKAVILGSGGASMTVCAVLRDRGAAEIITVSRSGENSYENIGLHADAAIIVNTTPVGMYPNTGVSPVSLDMFKRLEAVIDVIYNPAKTELLLCAEDSRIPCAGGLIMLAAQAKRAAEIFTGRDIPDDMIDAIADKITRETRNIALVGMPGCGKSATGALLAELTGRRFYDTDELVISRAGKSIERIFAEDGEAVFRKIETDVLKDVSAQSGCVIATGGGIVTQPRNRRLLRQNSVTVFLERDIGELSADGRPLSLSRGVAALYAERLPLYQAQSDFTVRACGAPETARAIMEMVL